MKKFYHAILFVSILFLICLPIHAEDVVTYDIYYFHATIRCEGCIRIEDFTNSSLAESFEKELKSGLFKYSSIDFLQPENEHFQTDYNLEAQTLIISKKVNGKEVKWINLDKIWEMSSDIRKYKKYISTEIKKFIKSKSKVK